MTYLKTKNPTNEQINGYKMTEKRINEKFRNLNEEEWNRKSNKIVYVFTTKMLLWLLLLNAVEVKKKRHKNNK